MDKLFAEIAAGSSLREPAARDLRDRGFVIIPGPVPPVGLAGLAAAYDAAAEAAPEDISTGRTTTRMHGIFNHGPAFDELYVYPPILDACARTIGRPFKLSTLLARAVRPGVPAQGVHVDFPGDADGWPMVGFILMLDEFRADNGTTRFVPGSHRWTDLPGSSDEDLVADYEGQVLACGPPGSVVVYNGSVWHGHTANSSAEPRRSIQGAYIRRDAPSAVNKLDRMRPETLARIGAVAKYLLDLP